MDRPLRSPSKSPLDEQRAIEIYRLKIDDVLTMIDHHLIAQAATASETDALKVDAPAV
jgi:hypothetical protein